MRQIQPSEEDFGGDLQKSKAPLACSVFTTGKMSRLGLGNSIGGEPSSLSSFGASPCRVVDTAFQSWTVC